MLVCLCYSIPKMRNPKRILKKLVGPNIDIKRFEVTDEPLEQAVETFRDVIQCRKIRDFLKDFNLNLINIPTYYVGKIL